LNHFDEQPSNDETRGSSTSNLAIIGKAKEKKRIFPPYAKNLKPTTWRSALVGYNRDKRRWENENYHPPIFTQKPPKSQGVSAFGQHKHL